MLIHGNWSINKRYLTLRNRASKEKKDAYNIGAVVGEQPWIRVFRTVLVWRFEDNHWMWTLRLPRTLRKNSPLDRYKRSCKQLKLKIYDESKTLSRILFDVSSTIFTKPSFEHYQTFQPLLRRNREALLAPKALRRAPTARASRGVWGHAPPGNFANLVSLKWHFLHFDIIFVV